MNQLMSGNGTPEALQTNTAGPWSAVITLSGGPFTQYGAAAIKIHG